MFTYSLKKKTLSMVIDGDIFRSWWGDSIDSQTIRNALAEHEGKFSEIALDITSNGGDVTVGMAIYTLIKDQVNRGIPVNVRVVGIAASMGSIIALAGTTLEIVAGSWVMIHNPLALTIGDYREHESRTETLRTMRDTLADIYESRSDMPKESILSKMDSETWFSAEKAVQHGFASKILVSTEPTASATSPQTILASRLKSSIIAQNFKNIPESLKTILNSDTDPVGDSSNGTPHNLPIISGATPAQSKGDSMDELNQFLASNPTAKAAHEKLIAEAKVPVASAPVTPVAEPVQPAAPVAQSPVANVSPEIVAKSNAYPEQIRAMAVACLVDPENITAVASFNAVIAMHDMNVAQASATAAATATAQTGETPPVAQAHGTPPVASAQNPAGLISDAESAKALFSTVKG